MDGDVCDDYGHGWLLSKDFNMDFGDDDVGSDSKKWE